MTEIHWPEEMPTDKEVQDRMDEEDNDFPVSHPEFFFQKKLEKEKD